MKFTDEELVAEFRKVWPHNERSYGEISIEVELNMENHIRVELSSMYDPPGLTFAQLMLLSEAFGTKQIDAGDKRESLGCETCDYGSSYGFVVDIKPEPTAPTVG